MTTNTTNHCPADYHEMTFELTLRTAEIAKAAKAEAKAAAEAKAKAAAKVEAAAEVEGGGLDSLWVLFMGDR